MSDKPSSHHGPPPAPPDDPPVDVQRVALAVRRNRRGIAAAVGLVTLLVLVVSMLAPDRYRTTARIASDPVAGQVVDADTADRQLATDAELVTARPVLGEAARRLPGESAETLAQSVSATFDPAVSMLDVVATAEDAARSRQIANTVAETFVAERDRAEARIAARARERLAGEIERQRTLGARAGTLAPMRERLSELAVDAATASSGLRIVQRAPTPDAPYAPRPFRSAVLAFLAALLVAVLVAIFRDQVRPARPDVAGLTRVTGLPLLAALPATMTGPWERLLHALGRRSRTVQASDQAVIEEAALQGAVRSALPARGQRIVLVHGIDDSDGAAQAAARLARSLTWGGHAAVLVRFAGADARHRAQDDVPTVWCTDLDEQLDELKLSEYRYVVVEAPRTARGARLRPLAARSAAVLLVARLDVATFADAAAARRLVDALGLRGLGLVVICSPSEVPELVRTAMTAPLRPPRRAASPNGAQAPVAAEHAQ